MAENTLGAPTEGLGQTVTFAAQGAGGVPQASAGGAQAVRNDMRGGGHFNTPIVQHVQDIGPDPTMATLYKMGEAIIAPKIKELQMGQYVKGMQAAAAGQAITDIVEEQPWYFRAFGSTNMVDGARAYTAFTKTNEVNTGIQAAMPELRKLSGPEFADHIQKQVAATATGDAATDAMMFQQVMKTMPDQMMQQTKHHYVWQQERMADEQRKGMGSALTNVGVVIAKYRNAAPGDAFMPAAMNEITDGVDASGATVNALAAFERPDGQDPKVHSRNTVLALSAALAEGNLFGAYAMQDAGVVDRLEPDDKVHFSRALDQAERKQRLLIDAPLAIQGAHWQTLANEPTTDPALIIQGAKDLNAQYAKMTGSRMPLVAQADTVRELVQLETTRINAAHREAARLAHEGAKAATADAKQTAHNQKIELGAAAFSTGSDFSFLTEREAQEAWAHKRQVSSDDQYFSAMAASAERKGGINVAFRDTLQTELNLAVSQSNPQTLFDTYTKHYLPLRKAGGARGMEIAAKYTDDYAAKMDDYHRFMQATGAVSEGDKVVAMLKFTQPRAKPNHSKDAVEYQKVAAQKGTWNTLGNLFSDKPPLDSELAPQFVSELMPYMDNLPEGLDTKSKLREAGKLAGIEQFAGTYWKRGLDQKPIEEALVRPTGPNGVPNPSQIQVTELDEAIKLGFSKKLAEVGLKDTNVSTYRMPDNNGEAMFYVLSHTPAGEPNGIMIRGSEIQSAWAAHKTAPVLSQIEKARTNVRMAQGGYGADYMPLTEADKASTIAAYKSQLNSLLVKAGLPTE